MATESPELLECPECKKAGVEKKFERPQALGAHRSRSHGVKGKNARKRKNRTQQPEAAPRQPRMRRNGRDLDRNKLLSLVFPEGIPAKAEIITEVETWLKDAEHLAHAK